MNFDRIDGPEKQRPGRALSLGLLFAAACCVSAVAGNVWNSRDAEANSLPDAYEALPARDETDAKQAAYRLHVEAERIFAALRERAARPDAVGVQCSQYLAGLARSAQAAATAGKEKPK